MARSHKYPAFVLLAFLPFDEFPSLAWQPSVSVRITIEHNEASLVTGELAEQLLKQNDDVAARVRGFDLAGNEGSSKTAALREAFMPMMEKCLHITIHAGETQEVQSVWEAVYHLSAERVGHGLTLKDDSALMEKFKDRNIAIEMCPSSNFQIVGFQDRFLPSTAFRKVYPLKEYLDQGLRVTVNSDNPGISRTDFASELHKAARMTPGGLSLWEICLLIKNGFRSSFAKRQDRHAMLLKAEAEILSFIEEGLPV